jgi:hypothetical protein
MLYVDQSISREDAAHGSNLLPEAALKADGAL